ncbi:Protease 4 [Sinobacterium norvegicum]|uniref:Protease 4 n=1 Tax=Sinobacterium norvegicum TaxID=1641715 RepID=A0ABM9AHS6_9GAMM|nr:signal peptide peptidase SppA [Sinobacterium norvegicum]CAH0992587.1 Protease 4 [Sinobacterium norvegicum]
MTLKKKPGIIRRVFGGVWGLVTWLRRAVLNIIFIVIIAAVFFALKDSEQPSVPDGAVVAISPTGVLVEQRSYNDTLFALFNQDETNAEVVLSDIIDAVNLAEEDDNVSMIVMQLDNLRGMGMTHAFEISQAISDFQQSGKKVLFRSNNFSQSTYLLASFADEVYLHPMGGVELKGLAVYRSYFKALLDKLYIDFHVFRVGTYKSALEPMMRNDMSEADRASNSVWLSSLWQQYTTTIEANRALKPGQLNEYINNSHILMQQFNGDSAKLAQQMHLIDDIKSRAEYTDYISTLIEGDIEDHLIDFRDYIALSEALNMAAPVADKIALINAEGNIVNGHEPYGAIGGDSLSELIEQAAQDDSVKALVLRINSGGGSAFASEVIREQILRFKATDKKLVISMGPVTASGGYWISADADEIWAMPTTLTGSIGIFAALPNIERGLRHIGISNDGVATTDIAAGYRPDRALDDKTQAMIQSQIENGYERFLTIVAEGRGMSVEQVEVVAEGRVWSGQDAYERGLVDQLGSTQDAIASAAKLAGVEAYEVELISPILSAKQQFMLELSGASAAIMPMSLQAQTISLLQMLGLEPLQGQSALWFNSRDPKGFYAQCTECMAP